MLRRHDPVAGVRAGPRAGLSSPAILLVAFVSLLLLAWPDPAGAAPDGAAAPSPSGIESLSKAFPGGMSAAQVDAVVAVMGDAQARALLREMMHQRLAVPAETPPTESSLDFYERRLGQVAAAYGTLPAALEAAFASPLGSGQPLSPWRLVLGVAAMLAAGWAVQRAVHRAIQFRQRTHAQAPMSTGERIGSLLSRLVLDAVEIGAFLAGAGIVYLLVFPPHPAAPAVLSTVIHAALVLLVTRKLIDRILAPANPAERPLPVADVPARKLGGLIWHVTVIGTVIDAIVGFLSDIGLPPASVAALALPMSLVPLSYLLIRLAANRRRITEVLASFLQLDLQRYPMLATWPLLIGLIVVGLWLAIVDGVLRQEASIGPRALFSFVTLLLMPTLAWMIRRPLIRFYERTEAESEAERPGISEADMAHVNRLMRAVWAVLFVGSLMIAMLIWDLDPSRLGLGSVVVRVLFNIGAILLLGYVGWALVTRWIDHMLMANARDDDTGRAQRLRTLLPLFRKFLLTVIAAMLVMIVLSSLGVEIGPLLAGAGVVGIAVGLGAQQTIADILAGVFFLLEDAFRIGDYVEVGNLRGTVENISARSLKLRHHRGAVHTLPFGQMKSLTNYSRDWALVRLEFRVGPDTDLQRVKKLIKEIGKELAADPTMGPSFIQPLKSQGVRRVEDNALIVGVKYVAKAGQQFVIRREAYHKIVNAFMANGIELIGRGVVVRVESGGALSEQAVGAAAAEAVREDAVKAE